MGGKPHALSGRAVGCEFSGLGFCWVVFVGVGIGGLGRSAVVLCTMPTHAMGLHEWAPGIRRDEAACMHGAPGSLR